MNKYKVIIYSDNIFRKSGGTTYLFVKAESYKQAGNYALYFLAGVEGNKSIQEVIQYPTDEDGVLQVLSTWFRVQNVDRATADQFDNPDYYYPARGYRVELTPTEKLLIDLMSKWG